MPRTRPIKKLDVIGLTDRKPDEAIGEYIESKKQDKFFVKPPNWDSPSDSIELIHIQHEREHVAMLELQKNKLAENERLANLNKHRTDKLYKTQAHLRKRFIEVNGFLKDISEKAAKDKKITENELILHKKLNSDIDKFRKSIEELTDFREKIKQTVEEYQPYERVMDEVLEKSNLFESTTDCMARCDGLLLAQFDIKNVVTNKIKEIEQMRQKMATLSKEVALKTLGVQTDLNNIVRSYLHARDQCAKWEDKLRNAKIAMSSNEYDKARTHDSIQILYGIFCKRKDVGPSINPLAIEKIMDFIKYEMDILRELVEENAQREKSEFNIMAHKKC